MLALVTGTITRIVLHFHTQRIELHRYNILSALLRSIFAELLSIHTGRGAVRHRAPQRNATQRILHCIWCECVDVRCRATLECKGKIPQKQGSSLS